ncbi:MAG: type II secretion system protein [Actinomycetes bacterium]
MLARIYKSMEKKDRGFTLIELLVVMIIIGILAAIAIPVFLSQRAKAQDSAAKADVSTIGKEIATFYVDGTGAPPTVSKNAGGHWVLGTVDIGKASDNVAKIDQSGTGDTDWCIAVENLKGSQKYYVYSAADGLTTGTAAGCP